ncbi:hypothetical protein DICSQDRAFT_50077 [Dichomitus squalens LYAD-421 SS1]|uniref:uncharacterized protein n=1 Tax=Dichomitus squalens (strain LYAD-421) TaxID=732165 RepID=UPI0004413680|nr:uncharacterized protein DICSQDRAFT_50077 [Dichomitus squalens LYAD-421 SS1]EJF65833.1 hypothetical protein DICSQDRAFT_50077 [Dichomitus squalens LYAD-421 SS1]
MQQELPLAGYDQLRPLGTPAARLPTQIVPPIPRAPEFLRQPSEQSSGLHSQVNALAGPSSRPQDVPLNTVSKESLEPTLPTSSPILPGPTPPDEPRSNPPPPRITCKGWSVPELCGKYTNFREVRRVKASALSEDPSQVLDDYERKGEPLIVEGLHQHSSWREDILNMEWLLKNAGDKEIHVRNVHNRKDYPTTFAEFVRMSRDQDVYNSPGETQRLYWKDADCPTEWKEWLAELLPAELLPGCSSDLLRHLYPSEAVESLMCYLGIGDTFTAAHKDLCSSSGHNLMCFSENGGSSFWFMTESNAAPQAAEWFQKELGQELDWETHVTTVDELGKAPFNVYIAEQKVGDLVLVPPRSVHQVVNQGGLAMKTSWSRMTLHGLRSALHHELPVYRRVCRPEQYRVKTILYRTMLHHTQRLQSAVMETSTTPSPQPTNEDRAKSLRDLIQLFDEVLREEYASCHKKLKRVIGSSDCSGWSVATEASTSRKIVLVPPRDARDRTEKHRVSACNFACDFCGADIFQSFFECRACSAAPEECTRPGDGLLICPACYVEGRSCACDGMEPVQCRPLQVLIDDRNRAAAVLREVGNNLSGDGLEDLRPRCVAIARSSSAFLTEPQ